MTEKIDQGQRHWISKAIESLDPEKDYELMWRLMACYRVNDFMNNLTYTLTFPNFIVTPYGAEVVWRKDGGKVTNRATRRVEDTENYNMTWWYYGPSDERCLKSVDRINKLHASFHRNYPGNFSHMEDYVYVGAFSTVLMHRLRLRLGLPGFSDKEKIAAHHFWRDMVPLFIVEDHGHAKGFPSDFDNCLNYVADYENIPRQYNENTKLIGLAIYNHFAFRYFPPGLRWLGIDFCLALSLPTTLRVMGIKRPNTIITAFVIFVIRTIMWFSETFLSDPKVAFITELEKAGESDRRKREEELNKIDQAYGPYLKKKLGLYGCPYRSKFD